MREHDRHHRGPHKTRAPAVAGMFYPEEPAELKRTVAHLYAANGEVEPLNADGPKALIVPHAGYVYSGQLAARAFAQWIPAAARIRRIVLFGPAHRVPVRGLAVPTASAFATPAGVIPVDTDAVGRIMSLPFVVASDAAHAQEHSLEVQLPLLQRVLPRFSIVPLVVGDATSDQVAAVMGALWDGDETRIVVSSDLSHFLDDRAARAIDAETADAIERLDDAALTYDHACGRGPISGLLAVARAKGFVATRIGLCNSSDTVGPKDRVVGYGAWAIG